MVAQGITIEPGIGGSSTGDGRQSSGPKKQSARMMKCECTECGYLVRTAKKWLDEKGPPHCPDHGCMKADGW